MIRIGVIGNSYLTNYQMELLAEIPHFNLSGIFLNGNQINDRSAVPDTINFITSYKDLLNDSDGIVFPEHSWQNISLIISALKNSKHLLIDNPYYFEPEKFEYLLKLAEEANVIFKLRQPIQFTPIIRTVKNIIPNPVYIDINRSIKTEPSGNQSNGLIIPALLQCVEAIIVSKNTNVRKVYTLNTPASEGVPMVFNTRIEFDNGSVTNITINRFAREDQFNCHYYKDGTHVSVDLLTQSLTILEIDHSRANLEKQHLHEDKNDPVVNEIIEFAQNISNHSIHHKFSGNGYPTYHITNKILDKIGLRYVDHKTI